MVSTDFLIADQNLPFSISLAMMLIITVLEGLGMVFGTGISSMIGHFSSDADLHVPHVDTHGTLSTFFSWLNIGRVPITILLIIILTCFGLIGFGLQALFYAYAGMLMPSMVAAIGAFAASMPVIRSCSSGLSRIMPTDETTAISSDELVGRIAVIITGKATHKSPAQAKVKDAHNQQHYIMLEPDVESDILEQGEKVLLVRREGHIFYSIRNLNENLL